VQNSLNEQVLSSMYHSSRHTFAVMLLESGVKIYTVSKLMGHRDLQTTLVYANILDETKRKAVNLLTDLEVTINEQEAK